MSVKGDTCVLLGVKGLPKQFVPTLPALTELVHFDAISRGRHWTNIDPLSSRVTCVANTRQ